MEIIIKRRALLSALAGAKAAYPHEFICLLTGSREKPKEGGGKSAGASTAILVIDDTVIPPGIMVSETMSSFSEWMLPTIDGMVGIFHSHPNGDARPSRQDRRLFSQKGGINLIAGYPFEPKNVCAYIASGREVPFKVVD